jgi:hypothetical protein
MSYLSSSTLWISVLVGIAALYVIARCYFAPEAIERRRRRRSHGRVVSKVSRPMVSLAVNAQEDEKPDKR